MKSIVIAFDGSENALNAINEANKIRVGFPKARITILEVVDISKIKDQALDLSIPVEERKKNRISSVEKQLDGIIEDYKVMVLFGDPATEIIKHMKESEYDLLIMGSRGLNLLQEFVMGSVSHKVVKHSSIPVLIVK